MCRAGPVQRPLTQATQPQHVRGNPGFSGPRDKQNPAGLPEPRAEAGLPTRGMRLEAGPPERLHGRAVTFQIMLNFLGVWSSPSTTAQVGPMAPSLFGQPPPPQFLVQRTQPTFSISRLSPCRRSLSSFSEVGSLLSRSKTV